MNKGLFRSTVLYCKSTYKPSLDDVKQRKHNRHEKMIKVEAANAEHLHIFNINYKYTLHDGLEQQRDDWIHDRINISPTFEITDYGGIDVDYINKYIKTHYDDVTKVV